MGLSLGTWTQPHQGNYPPKGPPGIKGRRLREDAQFALDALNKGEMENVRIFLEAGIAGYDQNET